MSIQGPCTEDLVITPKPGYKLVDSDISMQDGTLWRNIGKTPGGHTYQIANAYSSQEFVHVDGTVVKPAPGSGGNGEPPPFHVTVPAVDIDWKGHTAWNDEQHEDTNTLWVTDQTNQTFYVNPPREMADDMPNFTHDAEDEDWVPNLRLRWNAAQINVYTNDVLILPDLMIPRSRWLASGNPAAMVFKASRNTNSVPTDAVLDIRLDRMSTTGDVTSGPEGTSGTYDVIKCKTLSIEWPQNKHPSKKNTMVWDAFGLLCERFLVVPSSAGAESIWKMSAFPEPSFTSIAWTPHVGDDATTGLGSTPSLLCEYQNPSSEFNDKLPPNNSWFGQKSVAITAGDHEEIRPVWVYFDVASKRPHISDGKNIAAWYHYWKQGAVAALSDFEYVDSLGEGVLARHTHTLLGEKFEIAFIAAFGIEKPVIVTNGVAMSYSQVPYPDGEGLGIHGVAKTCAHEKFHAILRREVRSPLLGGLGLPDDDGDGLSNAREAEISTDPSLSDTFGLSLYSDEGANYSRYADYADQELYCRIKVEEELGNVPDDWAFTGTQDYTHFGE